MMKEPPQPSAVSYSLIEELGATTACQPIRVARQREEQGIEALMARIHVDEDAYADAAD
jgi:hypothetical protein